MDSDDLSRGFLVSRVLGRGDASVDDAERGPSEGADSNGSAGGPREGGSWGPRGISVSADEGVMDQAQRTEREPRPKSDEMARLVEEDDTEDEIWTSTQDTNRMPDNIKTHGPK